MTKWARCVECGRRYERAPSAVGHQCVCGPECRKARRRRQAKLRRAADVQYFREEERRRQRESRARRQAVSLEGEARAGPELQGQGVTECHAPASRRNSWELLRKARQLWGRQVRVSRASLDRELKRIGQKFEQFVSDELGQMGHHSVVSRASLQNEVAGFMLNRDDPVGQCHAPVSTGQQPR